MNLVGNVLPSPAGVVVGLAVEVVVVVVELVVVLRVVVGLGGGLDVIGANVVVVVLAPLGFEAVIILF